MSQHNGGFLDKVDHFIHHVLKLPLAFTHRHLLSIIGAIILVVGTVAYAAGFEQGITYNAQYFAAKYNHTTAVDHHRQAPVAITMVGVLPVSAFVNTAIYPSVQNQGSTGSCQAFSAAMQLSFLYRRIHRGSFLRFSPRYLYDEYLRGKSDSGSYLEGDVAKIAADGVPKYKAFPFGPNSLNLPDYGTEWPIPGYAIAAAQQYKFPVTVQTIAEDPGGGQGVIDAIKQAIVQNYAVNIDFEVFPGYDQATQTGGIIENPTPGQVSRGGHANTIIGFSDSIRYSDGSVGGFRVRNQWSTAWGDHGDGWMSYSYVESHGWGLKVIHALGLSHRK